jgi:predicted DNA-binding ribbon-helix-helix protein
MMKTRRIDIFGHQTSLTIEPEYWLWIAEIRTETGLSLRDFVEKIAVKKPHGRSLASAVRVAIAKYFHGGNPHDIYRCPAGIVPMRNGGVALGWPGGRRRAQEGPRPVLVDLKYGTRKSRSASRSAR